MKITKEEILKRLERCVVHFTDLESHTKASEWAHNTGMRWCTGASYLADSSYGDYKDGICHDFNNRDCCSLEWAKNHSYTIIPSSEFISWITTDTETKEFTIKDMVKVTIGIPKTTKPAEPTIGS